MIIYRTLSKSGYYCQCHRHRQHQRQRSYAAIITAFLLPLFRSELKMNCSAISLAHATTATTNRSSAFNGGSSFLNNKVSATVMAPIINNHSIHTNSNNNSNNIGSGSGSHNNAAISKKPEIAAKLLQESDIVCFDVDSTVIAEEGIDELAKFCGKGDEVARLTREAMGGGGVIRFQDALRVRLNILRPSQQNLSDFMHAHPSPLTRNVKALIEKLKADKKEVYLVSGGFRCLIEPVARELQIPMKNVFANRLMFYFNGEYADFDVMQPTSKTGGKSDAINIIRRRHEENLKGNGGVGAARPIITMIGDGSTDLEAQPAANYFIGFGGNVVRPDVYKRAQYYVTDFAQLMY